MKNCSYILIKPLSRFESPEEIRRTLTLLKECGYDGVELNLTEPLGVALEELKRWTEELELRVPSFLTGEAYNDGLCLSSPDASIRSRTVERLVSCLDTAREFQAILVVGLLQGLRSDEPDADVAQERIVEGLKAVAGAAEQKGVEFVIEPVNHLQVGFNNSVGEVLRLVEAVGSRAMLPMVDTIHMNIEERSLVQPILDCGAALRHVHLCESNGALFGTGNIDFRPVLEALAQIDYKHFASVKVYRGATLEEAARSSIEYLRQETRSNTK